MPRKTYVTGNLGSQIAFAILAGAVAFKFADGDDIGIKYDDARYMDTNDGLLKSIEPDRQVLPCNVEYELAPPAVTDVALGDGYTAANGDKWVRHDGGAYNATTKTFSTDPPPPAWVAVDTNTLVDK